MIRRPPRSPLSSSSAASDVYKRQGARFGQQPLGCADTKFHVHRREHVTACQARVFGPPGSGPPLWVSYGSGHEAATPLHSLTNGAPVLLSLIHISEPTRLLSISYAVFCLKKKKNLYYLTETILLT
eukprot:TRINITY_DN40767_c0_g1_i1.p1 TRINITY_DN40767_c0_g1~~TRINITY_DN40767_c0_g1_i1.p1  ORF type:complete len:127 (+),score=20.03 TRINITY_DN40767_c0_g1_i1:76-456(+)